MAVDLSDDDKAAIAELLRDTIAADRFPHSPRIRVNPRQAGTANARSRPVAGANAVSGAYHGPTQAASLMRIDPLAIPRAFRPSAHIPWRDLVVFRRP